MELLICLRHQSAIISQRGVMGLCKEPKFCLESHEQEILWLEEKNEWAVSIFALTV